MSELIDRIFDAEKISAEVAQILAEVGKVVKGIEGYKAAIEGIEQSIRKSKGTDELIKGTQSLNDAVVKGGVEMKRYEAEIQKLNEKTEQLTGAEKAAAIEIAKARLELQAAQKATKEAALAQIELDAKTKGLTGSYNELQKDLKNASKAYRELSEAERNGAQGKELLGKITSTQKSLKEMDASMGNYQRNVGNYGSLLEGLTPKLGGLAGKLMDISEAAKKNKKDWDGLDNSASMGIQTMGKAPAGLTTIISGFKGLGQTIAAVGKALLANPILAVVAAIVAVFGAMKAAVESNGESTRKLGQILAPFKAILGSIMQVLSEMVNVLLDGAMAFGNLANSIMSFIPGLDKVADKNREAIALEKEKQKLLREGIVDKAFDAKEELRIAELKKKIMDSDKYSKEERLAMAKEIDNAERKLAMDDAKRANENLKAFLKDMKLRGKTQKDLTDDELKQLAELQAAKYKEQQAYYDKTTKLESKASKLSDAIKAEEEKAKADALAAEKERTEKLIAARRRLSDSSLAIMKDGKEKQIAISNEAYKREIEDLQRNGELTTQLAKNLKQKQAQELKKIDDEWKAKTLNDKIKNDELVLENMKKAGTDTLEFEKKLLNERKEAEILAGADRKETNKKYRFMELDLIAKNAEEKVALFQKEIEQRAQILAEGYTVEENEAKKQYQKILKDSTKTDEEKIQAKKDLEKTLNKIKLNALEDGNAILIQGLEKELQTQGLSEDKRLELSNKLTDLRIANENAVTDAVIKAGEDQQKADKEATEKRKQIAMELVGATMEVFGAISEYQKQQSDARIADLEKEQEASDAKFAKEQEQLDGAIMSDENRAAKQKELNEKKAAADKVIQDKIKAEKIKQAKWDKAQAIINAITSTALAVMKVFEQTGIFGFITSGLVAAAGAIQIATIASQPLPAFEHGGTTEGGAVLWGEKRAEVAVTPSGETFLADRPTVTEFDAGTRIYKSVSDYENAMSSTGGSRFEFDYDKMGEKMKAPSIVLDSRGLWGIVSAQNSRRMMINRRYSI